MEAGHHHVRGIDDFSETFRLLVSRRRISDTQERKYIDLPSSSDEFSASHQSISQPLRPTFETGLRIQAHMQSFTKRKHFSQSR